jgi:uncharacterized protein (TIGR03083 family)
MTSETRDLITRLRTLHDNLAAFTVELGADQLRERSYATEWSVADVLSHLGSGAELALLRLRAETEDSPSYEETAQVWATWNARTPEQQAVEAIAADEAYVAALESLDDQGLDGLHRELAGLDLSAREVLGLRISEHSMHGWDIAVMFDDEAVVPAAGVPALLAVLPVTLRFAAQPHDGELRVRVRTTNPDGDYVFELAQAEARLTPVEDSTDPTAVDSELSLPAEALLRLVYGRLDPRHTPPHKATDDAVLDRLRAIFTGF